MLPPTPHPRPPVPDNKDTSAALNSCPLKKRVNKHTPPHRDMSHFSKDAHTRTVLSPFVPSGHVTETLVSHHLSLSFCLFSPSLSHAVGICVLCQGWEEKLGRSRREMLDKPEEKKRGGRALCPKNKSRLSSSHSPPPLDSHCTVDATLRAVPGPIRWRTAVGWA